MSAKEGVSRIAKFISVISWVIAIGGVVLSVLLSLGSGREAEKILLIGVLFSAVLWGIAQGIVWIIDGFAGNKEDSSSLFWPIKRRRGAERGAQSQQNSAQTSLSSYSNNRPELRGVGGWLMFFIITIMVFSPLKLVASSLANFSDTERLYPVLIGFSPWEEYKFFNWMMAFIAIVIFVWCGWILLKHHTWASVRRTIICIWTVPILLVLGDVIAADYFLDLGPSETMGAEVTVNFAGVAIYATIWSLYLTLSRRVENTYPRVVNIAQPYKKPEDRLEPKI